MTRVKAWQNSFGMEFLNTDPAGGSSWVPYHALAGTVTVGSTLLRCRIQFLIELWPENNNTGDLSYPTPWNGWHTALAVGWDIAGSTALGYFDQAPDKWLWASQVAFDVVPFVTTVSGTSYQSSYCINTIETRVIDTKSERIATVDTDVTLMLDSLLLGSTNSAQFIPMVSWQARILTLGPDE